MTSILETICRPMKDFHKYSINKRFARGEKKVMDDSSYRLNFDLGKKNEIHTIARKSSLKLVKLQSLVAKCCKMRKIHSTSNSANLVYFCIACRSLHHFRLKSGANFCT